MAGVVPIVSGGRPAPLQFLSPPRVEGYKREETVRGSGFWRIRLLLRSSSVYIRLSFGAALCLLLLSALVDRPAALGDSSWSGTATMHVARSHFTATLLTD